MNRLGPHPWQLSFSYGRALQAAALQGVEGRRGEPRPRPQARSCTGPGSTARPGPGGTPPRWSRRRASRSARRRAEPLPGVARPRPRLGFREIPMRRIESTHSTWLFDCRAGAVLPSCRRRGRRSRRRRSRASGRPTSASEIDAAGALHRGPATPTTPGCCGRGARTPAEPEPTTGARAANPTSRRRGHRDRSAEPLPNTSGSRSRRSSRTRVRSPVPCGVITSRRRARGAQPGATRGRGRARRPAAHRRRRRLGQDPRPHPPDRVPDRRAARLPVRPARDHVHQQGRGRDEATRRGPRRARRAPDVGLDVPLGVRPHPPPRGAGARAPLLVHDLRPVRRRAPRRLRPPRPQPGSEAVPAPSAARADLGHEERAGLRRRRPLAAR